MFKCFPRRKKPHWELNPSPWIPLPNGGFISSKYYEKPRLPIQTD